MQPSNKSRSTTLLSPDRTKPVMDEYHGVVVENVGGPSRIRRFDLAGELPVPEWFNSLAWWGNDGRVKPAHSRKMTARLQDASASGNPILVRLTADSGHGMGTALNERISEQADVFALLFRHLKL